MSTPAVVQPEAVQTVAVSNTEAAAPAIVQVPPQVTNHVMKKMTDTVSDVILTFGQAVATQFSLPLDAVLKCWTLTPLPQKPASIPAYTSMATYVPSNAAVVATPASTMNGALKAVPSPTGKCPFILTRGPKAGSRCDKNISRVAGATHCSSHSKSSTSVEAKVAAIAPQPTAVATAGAADSKNKCPFTITKGKRAGESCGGTCKAGTSYCSRHARKDDGAGTVVKAAPVIAPSNVYSNNVVGLVNKAAAVPAFAPQDVGAEDDEDEDDGLLNQEDDEDDPISSQM